MLIGASRRRIYFKEILPNLWAPLLVTFTLTMPVYVSAEAALSYLDVGIKPPTPTLGNVLAHSISYSSGRLPLLLRPGVPDRDHRRQLQPARRRHARRARPQGRRVDPDPRRTPQSSATQSRRMCRRSRRVTHRRRSNVQLSKAGARSCGRARLGLRLAACGGGSDDGDGTSGTRPPEATKGGTLNYLHLRPFENLDPQRIYVGRDITNLSRTVYRSLVAFPISDDPDEANTPVPDLATDTGTATRAARSGRSPSRTA